MNLDISHGLSYFELGIKQISDRDELKFHFLISIFSSISLYCQLRKGVKCP